VTVIAGPEGSQGLDSWIFSEVSVHRASVAIVLAKATLRRVGYTYSRSLKSSQYSRDLDVGAN